MAADTRAPRANVRLPACTLVRSSEGPPRASPAPVRFFQSGSPLRQPNGQAASRRGKGDKWASSAPRKYMSTK